MGTFLCFRDYEVHFSSSWLLDPTPDVLDEVAVVALEDEWKTLRLPRSTSYINIRSLLQTVGL